MQKPLARGAGKRFIHTGAAYVIRTRDLRFTKSPTESGNAFDGKELKESRNPLSCQPLVSHDKPTGDTASLGDLAQIVAAWPRLPEAIKAGMVAMVKACIREAE